MEHTRNVSPVFVKLCSDYAVRLIAIPYIWILPSTMLTCRFPSNFILVFHELKYEVLGYVTNFEGSFQRWSSAVDSSSRRKTLFHLCFNYVYFVIVLLFLRQNEKLSYIFFHLIVFLCILNIYYSILSKSLEEERRYKPQGEKQCCANAYFITFLIFPLNIVSFVFILQLSLYHFLVEVKNHPRFFRVISYCFLSTKPFLFFLLKLLARERQ